MSRRVIDSERRLRAELETTYQQMVNRSKNTGLKDKQPKVRSVKDSNKSKGSSRKEDWKMI